MRIATSTVFADQTATIDNLSYQQTTLGTELSSGIALNQPSDDPQQIGEDLSLHTAVATENTAASNIQNATNQLTYSDSALSSLTDVLQSANQLAVEGASDTLSTSQRQAIAGQVSQLLTEAVNVANTTYDGQYLFAGTSTSPQPPIQTQGSPPSSVSFSGNNQTQSQNINGQVVETSTTMQEAFNYGSTDGTPNVFQVLMNLRDTLSSGTVVDQSATAINQQGTTIGPDTQLGSASLATALTADSSGNYSFSITGAPANGAPATETFTFSSSDTISNVIAQINAATGQTGVSASFNVKSQKLILTGQPGTSFNVQDVSSPGASNTANFVEAFGLSGTADFTQNISTQIGDIQNSLNVTLSARAVIGGRIDALNDLSSQNNQAITDNTQLQSQIEDTDVASTVTQFSQTQTALEAAYATTSQLESKILFDYIQG